MVEIANGGHGEKGKIEGVNWNSIEQIHNETISEIKQTGRKTGFFVVLVEGSSDPDFGKSIKDPNRSDS